MNLETIRMIVRHNLGIVSDNDYGTFLDEYLNHFINEGQRKIRIDLEDVVENAFNTFQNQREHTLPSDYLKEKEVWVNRNVTTGFQGYQLEPTSYANLTEGDNDFTTRTDPNTNITEGRPKRYYISEEDVLFVDPIPSTTDTFDLFYYPIPSEMTSDLALPDMKEIYHNLIATKAAELVAFANIKFFSTRNQYKIAYRAELEELSPLARSKDTSHTKLTVNTMFTRV